LAQLGGGKPPYLEWHFLRFELLTTLAFVVQNERLVGAETRKQA
jgi:hypothetical protein